MSNTPIAFDRNEQPVMEKIWQAWQSDKDYIGPDTISHIYGQWVSGSISILLSEDQVEQLIEEATIKEDARSRVPFVAFGNDEIEDSPDIGGYITCEMCGKRHRISYGDKVEEDGTLTPSTLLAFYKCGGKSYLAGIDGKDIRRK